MKKSLFTLAFILGASTVSFANSFNTQSTEIVAMVDEFTPIDLKDVPAPITDAIAKNYTDKTVKEAFMEVGEDGTKIFKLVLVDKDEAESTVFYKEDGEEVKPVQE